MQGQVFRVGDRCGEYKIAGFLGSGGFSEVYSAAHVATGDVVALKCLQLQHGDNARVIERMTAEAELLNTVDHQNLVEVLDFGRSGSVLFMAMELLRGRTLRGELDHAKGPLPLIRALYIAREIADGLDAAHERGVVHRDLKPENVFVTNDDKVKVLDLGAGKFFGWGLASTSPGFVVGTPLYMSPEHVGGKPVDARTDVYALGLMLYEMCARHPLKRMADDGASNSEIAILQMNFEPPALIAVMPEVPAYLSALVAKAMAKRPEDRFGSMSEMAQALRTARKRYREALKQKEAEAVAGHAKLESLILEEDPPPPESGRVRPIHARVDDEARPARDALLAVARARGEAVETTWDAARRREAAPNPELERMAEEALDRRLSFPARGGTAPVVATARARESMPGASRPSGGTERMTPISEGAGAGAGAGAAGARSSMSDATERLPTTPLPAGPEAEAALSGSTSRGVAVSGAEDAGRAALASVAPRPRRRVEVVLMVGLLVMGMALGLGLSRVLKGKATVAEVVEAEPTESTATGIETSKAGSEAPTVAVTEAAEAEAKAKAEAKAEAEAPVTPKTPSPEAAEVVAPKTPSPEAAEVVAPKTTATAAAESTGGKKRSAPPGSGASLARPKPIGTAPATTAKAKGRKGSPLNIGPIFE